MIGYRLLDLGETERGTQVLREGQRLADTLPKFVRGQRNPSSPMPAAGSPPSWRGSSPGRVPLAEGYSDPYDDWYKCGVALGLADRDPAGSERVFGMLKTRARAT